MRRFLCVILICATLWLCAGCGSSARETVYAMDTVMDLQVWGPEKESALESVKALITEQENTWSNQKDDSAISKLNKGEASLSPAQQAFLDQVMALSRRTGGAFNISWPKYWSFSISPSNEYSGLISFRIDWFDLLLV